MNDSHASSIAESEQLESLLDRLVDGEMTDPQRRDFLKRLDRAPEGWRRCALAFLEGQAFKEALSPPKVPLEDRQQSFGERAKVAPPVANPEFTAQSAPVARTKTNSWPWRPALGLLSVAACFVVAFGLGLLVQKKWLAGGDPAGLAEGPRRGFPQATVAGDSESRGKENKENWGIVQFVLDGPGGTPHEVRLPAVDGPDPEEFLRSQPPLLPPEIERELRRLGHRVEAQRQFVPIPLEDGRRVLVPIDNVNVRLFGGRGYQ